MFKFDDIENIEQHFFVTTFLTIIIDNFQYQNIGMVIRNFFIIGILGGYTTFSAFSLQTFILAKDGYWLSAGINVFLSVALCLIAVSLGYITASLTIR